MQSPSWVSEFSRCRHLGLVYPLYSQMCFDAETYNNLPKYMRWENVTLEIKMVTDRHGFHVFAKFLQAENQINRLLLGVEGDRWHALRVMETRSEHQFYIDANWNSQRRRTEYSILDAAAMQHAAQSNVNMTFQLAECPDLAALSQRLLMPCMFYPNKDMRDAWGVLETELDIEG